MKSYFAPVALRLAFLALPATSLLLSACATKETDTVAVDYSKQDDALIQKYLADNKITTAQKQPSGLYYVPVTTNATGTAAAGKTVVVLYTGTLLDNTVFDASSKNGNKPIEFVLGTGRVIKGWDEGIALMRKGEKGVLLIPSALGYGANGAGSAIPPNTVIKFDVELTDVK